MGHGQSVWVELAIAAIFKGVYRTLKQKARMAKPIGPDCHHKRATVTGDKGKFLLLPLHEAQRCASRKRALAPCWRTNQVIEPLQGHDAPKTSRPGTYLWFHKKSFFRLTTAGSNGRSRSAAAVVCLNAKAKFCASGASPATQPSLARRSAAVGRF